MFIIPLQAVPSQSVTVALASQNCQINIYQKNTGVFGDLYLNNNLVIAGVLGRNLKLWLMNTYLGFSGDLMWLDNQGSLDPYYIGIGSRYTLMYLLPSDTPKTSLYA